MQTYKYHFPASGVFESPKETKEYTAALEHYLKHSSDSLGAYAMFPSNSKILDKVTIDIDQSNGVTNGINLHTYVPLFDGRENDLKDAVESCVTAANQECYHGRSSKGMVVEGDVQEPVLEGEMPEKLYHIVEHEYVDEIMKDGINGQAYMNDPDNVYMCEENEIATWLAVLKHNEHPIIMEVNTKGLNIVPGGTFKDRNFAPDGYSQYVTSEFVPATAIKQADLTSEFSAKLRADMIDLQDKCISINDLQEVQTGMSRLYDMGVMKNATINAIAEEDKRRGKLPEVGEDEMDILDGDALTDAVNGINTPALGPILD